MKFNTLALWAAPFASLAFATPILSSEDSHPHVVEKRAAPTATGFAAGQPEDPTGKGGPILGGTNHQIDLSNPDNLGQQPTDSGVVPNLKWSFSDSKARIFNGGWTREQVVTDLPSSPDIAAAQQHLHKGAVRELHWHRVAEWGYVYSGEILISAVDENGDYQIEKLEVGDIWYFPKGAAHTIQGLADENEYLLVFDNGNFDAIGTTFMVDDWVTHTPKSVLAKNFGLNESVFANVPAADPYIINGTVTTTPPSDVGLSGNNSYVFHNSGGNAAVNVPGGAGNLSIIDSRNFPISTTIAAAVISLEPKGLRELHWHPNAAEWLYFHRGTARATVFIGSATARTIDFSAGDTAVFPDNSGHYIENTSATENLVWIEIYKSDRVADISLTQWLALTPPDIVANTLKIPVSVAQQLKKQKQLLVKGQ